MGKSMGWTAAGVLIALGAIGLAVLREGVAGLVEASSELVTPLGVLVVSGLAVVLGLRLAEGKHQPLKAAAGGTIVVVLIASPWLGAGPIVALGVFGLLGLLLVATTVRAGAARVGLGLPRGLVDGEGAVCAEAESERARAA